MDFSFSDLNFNSVETLPGFEARGAFTVNSSSVFREDCDIMPSTFGNIKYMPWGADNQMPYDIIDLIERDETLATCQVFNAEICYGSGLVYDTSQVESRETSDESNVTRHSSLNTRQEVEDFQLDNDLASYFLGVCQDFKHFGFAVSVIILNAEGTKVVRLLRKEACYCRFAVADNSMLMRYVPHSIKPVAGENPLFDKIEVHLANAEHWVEQNFTGEDLLENLDALSTKLVDALRLLVVAEALNRAIPSLDLVLTPNGFGVVNTNTVAAASKQRVDRLIGSMRELRDGAIEQALSLLPGEEDWVETPQAHFFATTLFPNIDLCSLCGHNSGRWEKYVELRSRAVGIELTLAEDYFSPELMSELRLLNLLGSLSAEQQRVVQAIRSQVVDVLQGNPINGNRMRDIVNFIRYRPGTFHLWHTSATAKLFSPPKFENKKQSSGYFF